MQKREERPGAVSRGGEAAEQSTDCASVFLILQVPVIARMDAIAQLLFSAGLIADVLPQLWSRDPQEGRTRQAELAVLAHGALAEVRKLLGELRFPDPVDGDQASAFMEKEQ